VVCGIGTAQTAAERSLTKLVDSFAEPLTEEEMALLVKGQEPKHEVKQMIVKKPSQTKAGETAPKSLEEMFS
jgi:hypothetical protein